ncbi:MAG TPA: DUF2306 domain-containing protein [Pararhizobium sp.]|nr:DUF2306 domain-containing protein [Pararhizobium sp.]
MFLSPIIEAPAAIQFHLATVIPAAVLGPFILFRRKGTALHKAFGRIWVLLMVGTAVSTFFIHTINMFYGFSPIHLLSILVIVGSVQAVLAARNGNIRRHRAIMRNLYIGGIGIAGLFTFVPGRLMHRVVFGVGNVFATPDASDIAWLLHTNGVIPSALVMTSAVLCAAAAAILLRQVRRRALSE